MDEYEAFYTKSFGGYTSDDSGADQDLEGLAEPEADADETPLEDGKEFQLEEAHRALPTAE